MRIVKVNPKYKGVMARTRGGLIPISRSGRGVVMPPTGAFKKLATVGSGIKDK
jgi:hypothetical protein